MNNELSSSAKKVQDVLQEGGFTCVVRELSESTRTAEEAAKAIGCEVAQIAKSLVFIDKASGDPVLVIASGANRIDLEKIEKTLGLHLVKAEAKYIKEKLGFAIGGVPPVGHKEKLRTLLDPTLMLYEWIWAAAGTPFAVFKISSKELQKMTGGQFVELSSR